MGATGVCYWLWARAGFASGWAFSVGRMWSWRRRIRKSSQIEKNGSPRRSTRSSRSATTCPTEAQLTWRVLVVRTGKGQLFAELPLFCVELAEAQLHGKAAVQPTNPIISDF